MPHAKVAKDAKAREWSKGIEMLGQGLISVLADMINVKCQLNAKIPIDEWKGRSLRLVEHLGDVRSAIANRG